MPVSNISFPSKVTEKIVLFQLSTYLNANKLFPISQSAYRPGHSTETAPLKLLNDVLHALDWGIYLIRTARIVQLSVVCKRLVGDGVLSNECSKRFCIQDEQNGSKDRPLWNAKVEHGWL